MIVSMKKVTVLAQRSDSSALLNALQALGVIHVDALTPPSASSEEIANRLRELEQAHAFLSEAPKSAAPTVAEAPLTVQAALALQQALQAHAAELAALERELETFAPFGEVDPQRIAALAGHGLHLKLYTCHLEQMPALPEEVTVEILAQKGGQRWWTAIARNAFALDLPELPLPIHSTSAIAARAEALRGEIAQMRQQAAGMRQQLSDLKRERAQLEDQLRLARAGDQMAGSAALVSLQGYCPVDAVDALSAAARQQGWGLIVTDPEAGDHIPTLIRNPRWLRPIEAVFDFIDTWPGYRERDISLSFLIFFSLFYAILIGDAAYGTIFLILLGVVHWRWGDRIPRQPLILFYILNVATVVWGIFTGSYFGITLAPDNPLLKLAFIDTSNQKLMMIVCFTIGLVHMSLAHLWNAVCLINSLKAVAEIGWLLVLWACYFAANNVIAGQEFPAFMLWVGVGGLVLALLCSGALTDITELLQFPFKIFNAFGDIVSYLRLFAVGSASVALAQVFNDIAMSVGASGPLAKLGMVLILILGHVLNLILGPLSVLVHGLRLNVLEFSSHLGQEWTGVRYAPLACRTASTPIKQGEPS